MNAILVCVWLLSASWMYLPQPTGSISDSIPHDTPLSGNQTIVSKNGEFELGFFAPNGTQNRYYVGIWYKTAPGRPIIWVANRVSPVSSPDSSELRISQQGNLVLLNQAKVQVWTSSPAPATRGTPTNGSVALVATLLDTGNLVLTSGEAGTGVGGDGFVLWQSFDEPTDTWLPGQKIGWNGRREPKGLISWRSPKDPSPGWYYFGLDPDGKDNLVQMWNGSIVYWDSGEWDGKIFSKVPEMTRNAVFNYVYNQTEKTLSYYLRDTSIVTRFVAERSGEGKQYAWLNRSSEWMSIWLQPTAQCDIYSYCGGFSICDQSGGAVCRCLPGYVPMARDAWDANDHTGGCRPSSAIAGCNSPVSGDAKGGKSVFLAMPNVRSPVNPVSPPVNANSTAECESACLKDCFCTAYVYDNRKCSTWNGNLTGVQQLPLGANNAVILHLRRVGSEDKPPQSSGSGGGSSDAGKIVGISLGVVAGVVLLAVSCVFLVRSRKRSGEYKDFMDGSLLHFRYDTLQRATNNFADRLGGGGFGSVFKGSLPPNSTAIAVKKLEGLQQGEKQFRTEVSTVGTIQHLNVVKLLGYCTEGEHRLLVYEYLPNGSLDKYLFRVGGDDEENPTATLDWKTRYAVALGVARGLAYLHDKCIECIIHCDIKPENILLDTDFCPKVSDLGLAKLIGRDFSRVLTTMRGTMGYLAPEWLSGEPITPKADVYAFGMMLFEIISGKRNVVFRDEGDFLFFPISAAKKVASGDVLSLVDHKVSTDVDMQELNRACKVACWCIQDGEAHRPSMALVVQVLEGVLDLSVPPVPKGLQHIVEAEEVSHFFSRS